VANGDQLKILKQGVEVWNQWREQNPDVAIDLFGIDLAGIDLAGANLSGADLSGEELRGANLQGANLSGANLKGSDLCEANLSGADLSKADLSGTDLTRANLSKANLRGANLDEADFTDADLREADLAKSDLKQVILVRAILTQANLSQADLHGAKVDFADLTGAKLVEANLLRTSFYHSNLFRADLSNASLVSANLFGAYCKEAILCGADLSRAQVLHVEFSNSDLTGACINDWNTHRDTHFAGVNCRFIYKNSIWNKDKQKTEYFDRMPASGEFAPGDFQKLFQTAINTVDLIFRHGIDWEAFGNSFLELQTQTGEELSISAIETRDDGSFVIRINVPTDAAKAEIEEFIYSKYKKALNQQTEKYRAQLATKDQEISAKNDEIIQLYREKSADLKEIMMLMAASKPSFQNINVGRDYSGVTIVLMPQTRS
jgi:uncharacterized protein YjbI with pentapeptide repeats